MVDRIETRSNGNKIDLRLQSLITSPYAHQQLQLAGLLNNRGQILTANDFIRCLSLRKRQRREHDAIAQDILLQTLKLDQNNRRGRRHQFEVATKCVTNTNFDIIDRQHRKQSHMRKKSREKSAPGYISKVTNEGETRTRVTSAHKRILKTNKDSLESTQEQNPVEILDKSKELSVEQQACNVTMCYGSKMNKKNGQPIHDEIVVMQQHTNGENLVVYRGFLTEGESFSFKSERRATSPLALAFYAKGFIDTIVNDCCEFKFGRRNQRIEEHSKFFVKRIRKTSPCEICQKKNFPRATTPIIKHKSLDTIPNDDSQTVLQRLLNPTPELSIDNLAYQSIEKLHLTLNETHENKKTTKYRKNKDIVHKTNENEVNDKQVSNGQKKKEMSSELFSQNKLVREKAASVDFSLLAYTLLQERKPAKPRVVNKPSHMSIIKGNFTKKHIQFMPQEKTSSIPSQGKEIMQAWVNETDMIPWEPQNSPTSTCTIDADTLSQTSVTHVQQPTFPN